MDGEHDGMFVHVAGNMLYRGRHVRRSMGESYVTLFGVSPRLTGVLWEKLTRTLPDGAQPKHLLWSLLFLKTYAVEAVHEVITGACRRTFRQWTWCIVRQIASLNMVSTLN